MKGVILRVVLLILFVGILSAMIGYARGYRFNIEQKGITSTGILVASSFPDGAKIYINGKLRGATNTNITLSPGIYDVEIRKEGYRSWKKSIAIKGEIVIKTDSLLFPQNPSLSPLTSLGVSQATYSSATNRIVFSSNIEDAEKDGIYLLETSKRTLSLFNPLKLLVLKTSLPNDIDYSSAQFSFSPDGKQVLLKVCRLKTTTVDETAINDCSQPIYSYVFSADTEKQTPLSITGSQTTLENAWNIEEQKNINKILETFKEPMDKIASDSFHILSFSPDDSKVLYKAKENITLPLVINPPLIGANQAPESRSIEKDKLYVYDKKEDKNYEIPLEVPVASPTPFGQLVVEPALLDDLQNLIIWFPDSRHLILNNGHVVAIIDYDGNTRQTVYSGPFDKNFLAVNTDGNLLILVNLNPNENQYPDVYTVGIR